MILTTHILVKVNPSTIKMLREKQYVSSDFKYHPRHDSHLYNIPPAIWVDVNHLLPGSNALVTIQCDKCGKIQKNKKICNNTEYCNKCAQSIMAVKSHRD